MSRRRQAKRRRSQCPVAYNPDEDELAMQRGMCVLLASGALMTVVLGSWLPMVSAVAAVGMAKWYVQNGAGNWLK